MSQTIVRVDALEKWFGKNQAIKGISFTINRGDVYGFIGKNGAGKTTVMRILCGLMRSTKGQVHICMDEAAKTVKPRIGYLPQSIRFDSNQSTQDIIEFFGKVKKSETDKAVIFAKDMGLDMKKRAKDMSPGQQRKLQLAVASIGDPELLVFDEPTAGLDPTGVQQVRDVIRELNSRGSTLFISSHVLQELDTVCDKVAVIDEGQLLYQGLFSSVYELDADVDHVNVNKLLDEKFAGLCSVSEGKLYARIDRTDVPAFLGCLYEGGVSVYGVKKLGLEMFYHNLMKEGA